MVAPIFIKSPPVARVTALAHIIKVFPALILFFFYFAFVPALIYYYADI